MQLLFSSPPSGLKNLVRLLILCVPRLSDLVETVSKNPIPSHQKNVILEIVCDDETGEDVEVPYVMLKLKR